MGGEYLSAFDKDGNFVGEIEKGEAHFGNPGVYHKAVWIWIFNPTTKEMLVQRRSKNMSSPRKWDFPSAGHVDFGEDLLATCVRETKEELGLDIAAERFEFLFTYTKHEGWEFGETFLLEDSTPTSEMTLDPHEVEEVKWLPWGEFKKLFYSDKFVAHAKEYKDRVCEIFTTRFGL